ncbi:hypothetical protein BDP27DRAFT_1367008 [Rhodocollybia butyracea]|uniref:Uncharacterized protein n=1 Tax=Rhodocollybia butyracea TaxID=206335 RepID=A0A9P5PK24_9AGAR|nr:hypothetical protein BDP27DRAFT_1367008 [Rhodocollybia butyracea]
MSLHGLATKELFPKGKSSENWLRETLHFKGDYRDEYEARSEKKYSDVITVLPDQSAKRLHHLCSSLHFDKLRQYECGNSAIDVIYSGFGSREEKWDGNYERYAGIIPLGFSDMVHCAASLYESKISPKTALLGIRLTINFNTNVRLIMTGTALNYG